MTERSFNIDPILDVAERSLSSSELRTIISDAQNSVNRIFEVATLEDDERITISLSGNRQVMIGRSKDNPQEIFVAPEESITATYFEPCGSEPIEKSGRHLVFGYRLVWDRHSREPIVDKCRTVKTSFMLYAADLPLLSPALNPQENRTIDLLQNALGLFAPTESQQLYRILQEAEMAVKASNNSQNNE